MNALQQRMGRCGRVKSGKLYRLIPMDFVDEVKFLYYIILTMYSVKH